MFPWQKDEGAPKFALLLTSLADNINVDRASLRQAGFTRMHSVSQGEKALQIIRDQAGPNPALAVDLLICAGNLDDMSLDSFMRALAALGSGLPVMVISGSEQELARAISQGAAATLRRPYSMSELARAVESVRAQKHEPAQARPAPARPAEPRPARAAAAPSAPPAEKAAPKMLWSRTGLKLLAQGKPGSAYEFLKGALEYDPLDLEAAMGLARLYQERGDHEKSRRWLHRAGFICLSTRQTERAELIFARLPEKWQGDHELIEAQELLLEGDYAAACEAFIHICTTRKGQALHLLLGRACQFTSAPEEAMREICAALMRAGYESTARSLAARLLTPEDDREWQPGGLLAHFPRLQEAWAVARFTAQALKAS